MEHRRNWFGDPIGTGAGNGLRAMGTRRHVLLAAAALITSNAHAQSDAYPSRPIQMVVPTTIGGGADGLARLIAQKITESTGKAVVVSNVPGAGGIIGVQKVASSAPDGYTVLFGFNQVTALNPSLIPDLAYDVDRDLRPVTYLAEQAYIWIAGSSFPVSTVPEWITLAKARPGKLTFAHNGAGSAANLGAEMFMQLSGSDILAVPYKNNATPDLLAGLIDLKLEPASVALPLVKAGRVKALAVTSASRLPALPQVPAMAEFFPGYVFTANYSIWLPKGAPQNAVDWLNAELHKVARQPKFSEQLAEMSVKALATTPSELMSGTQKEHQMWARLAKERNIKVEP